MDVQIIIMLVSPDPFLDRIYVPHGFDIWMSSQDQVFKIFEHQFTFMSQLVVLGSGELHVIKLVV